MPDASKYNLSPIICYLCNMRPVTRNLDQLDREALRERILKSMIASFKIENIKISDKEAREIYQRVLRKLKKGA